MELARAATSANEARKRKAGSADGELVELPSSSYDLDQHKKLRRRVIVVRSAPKSEAESVRTSNDDFSTSDHAESSCCSSNGSSVLVEDRKIEFVDLEADESDQVESSTYNSSRDERREMTVPTSEVRAEAESTAEPKEAESQRRSPPLVNVLELEEFFAATEKESQQKFIEKYNYDVVKDEPLEGRYEWIRLKP
ncbi:cyclin-dependent kinase inhibitor 7-like [Pyrus ussuriensis x Pyrus communis]|uniref:Cyclin-dependent kinase inhibitor n=1 Tax=Pyrus ussuriensis x Pyrus communis TaxID=2448454 RepID=A0A5N5HFM2_9ROSA|nr:cyclin-dependent kinase inhibitor 7-like [Pyrus ussuriensis x Pyrus communis]